VLAVQNPRHLSLLAVALFIVLSSRASAATIEGEVVRVADGDTVTVLDSSKIQHIIRLAGIDAPEKGQPFSNRSKQNLSDLVFRKHVVVGYDKIDRYGRLVGKVRVNGSDANLEQLRAGLAWVFRQYEHELSAEDRKSYNEAELSSRAARRGLWSDPKPQPPWQFRHPGTASAGTSQQKAQGSGLVIGNKRSGIYHLPPCPTIARSERRTDSIFKTKGEAEEPTVFQDEGRGGEGRVSDGKELPIAVL
jgi:endonuclease YncB( thermonuclease family)